jgi:DNA polymerase III subunit delta'
MAGADLPPWVQPVLARGLSLPAHALLLHGPGALGQFELGLALARGWLCEAAAGDGRACGSCPSCRLFDSHSHPDFRCLLPEAWREKLGWAEPSDGGDDEPSGKASKAKASREIKVDAVRGAIDWGQRTTARGRAKVILIHPAEAMNGVTANALLKTLEEPPGRLQLVLTAHDPESLLPTVRSRCQRLRIDTPGRADALAWLAAHEVAAPAVLLAATDGQPQAALALLEDGIDAASWERVPAWVSTGQGSAFASWPVARVVEALGKLCHDLMAHAAGGPARYFSGPSLAPALRPVTPTLDQLARWSRELVQAARHDEHPWQVPLRNEALVAQARALWHTPRDGRAVPGRALDTLQTR